MPYLDFIAPGLLASTAMQTASSDSLYPVIGAVKWQKQYLAMLATPLRVVDVMRGHVLWIAVRTFGVSLVYLVIMGCFGVLHSPLALLALPAATQLGMAFSTPLVAFSAGRERDVAFPIVQRLVLIPLFLFSGAFFPITQLPTFLQYVARLTPLWHGTQLCRLVHPGHRLAGAGPGARRLSGAARRRRPGLGAAGLPAEVGGVSAVATFVRSAPLRVVPSSTFSLRRSQRLVERQPDRLPPHLAGDRDRVLRAAVLPALPGHRARPPDRFERGP